MRRVEADRIEAKRMRGWCLERRVAVAVAAAWGVRKVTGNGYWRRRFWSREGEYGVCETRGRCWDGGCRLGCGDAANVVRQYS